MSPMGVRREDFMQNFPKDDRMLYLWVLLQCTHEIIHKVRDMDLSRYGIGIEQARVLLAINVLRDRATPANIARWLVREPHSASALLSRMERKGLINKTRVQNSRTSIIELSKNGRQILRKTANRVTLYNIMSELSVKEQKQMESMLKRLRTRAYGELGIELVKPRLG